MGESAWIVITRWLARDGSEYTHTAEFSAREEALNDMELLAPLLGMLHGGRILVGVRLVGEQDAFAEMAGV